MRPSPEDIIIRPMITEKSTFARMSAVYAFAVKPSATKIDIRRAVEQIFKVKVVSVNTAKVRGRIRRTGRSQGHTAAWKKAYVRLAPGQKIEMVEGMM